MLEGGLEAPALIGKLGRLLGDALFFESEQPTYHFEVAGLGAGGAATWTWDVERGMRLGASGEPTALVAMDRDALSDLLEGRGDPGLSLHEGRLRAGGLVPDIETLGAQFLGPEPRQEYYRQALRTTLPSQGKRALVARIDAGMRRIAAGKDAELERLRRMFQLWTEHRIERCRLDQWTRFCLPGLELSPWVEPAELGIDSLFQAALEDLRREALPFQNGEIRATHYGADPLGPDEPALGRPRGWRHWNLVEHFEKQPERCRGFPMAEKLIDALAERCTLVHAGFLIQEPGVLVEAHSDGLGWALSYHFGLRVPRGCYLKVAGEERSFETGEALLFNDSFVHSAGNPSNETRVNFNLVCANPRLSRIERQCLLHAARVLPHGTLAYSR